MGLTDKHLAYGDDIPQTQTEKDYYWKINHQQSCNDCISREAVLETIEDYNNDGLKGIFCSYNDGERFKEYIKALPSVIPKENTGYCKDCKWWKDNDGVYRRGIGAESKCPINCKEVYEGNGYCFMFKPQESEEEK